MIYMYKQYIRRWESDDSVQKKSKTEDLLRENSFVIHGINKHDDPEVIEKYISL